MDSAKNVFSEILISAIRRAMKLKRSFGADYESSLRWATAQYFSRYFQPWLFKTMILCRNDNFVYIFKTLPL